MFILIDKPKGITSHDVVGNIRRLTGIKKVGHGGTLDPNATGLLIIGIGRDSTKKLGEITQNTTKTYEAEIYLGEERDTDDQDGHKLTNNFQLPNKYQITKAKIKTVLSEFVGEQEQIPPQYSAIKIKGKKAYEMARKGKVVKLKPRKITIYSIKLINYKYPSIKLMCKVTSGTYIRALARDVGRKLETGAYLADLRRTKIGKFSVENAIKLDKLNKDNIEKCFIDLV